MLLDVECLELKPSSFTLDLVQSDVEVEPPVKRMRVDEVFTETITIDWNDDNVKVDVTQLDTPCTIVPNHKLYALLY